MKKRIKHIVLFLSILAILIIVVGNILEGMALKIDPNEPKVREVTTLENKDYQTLIMGNSISQQAFNPKVIDSIAHTNSYNMAIGGASIFSMELLLKNYLLSNEKPKLIIYGLYINEKEWPDKVRPSMLDELAPNLIDEYNANDDVERSFSLDFYNQFKIFRYRNVIEHTLKYAYNKERYSYDYYKGFIIKKSISKPVKNQRKNKAGENTKALERLITYCNSQKIELLFVDLPNHKAFNNATSNRDSVLTELHKIPNFSNYFIDMNTPEKYNDNDWAALNHLNIYGANKFSKEFSERLNTFLHKKASQIK